MSPARSAHGFTLVELLVALAIFAILSTFAWRGLTALLDSREALQAESRKWRDVALFVGRLERDLGAVLDRRATSASGTPLAPVSSRHESGGASVPGLALTRAGAALQDNVLASPQRVAYRLGEGRVERLAWIAVDAAPRAEPMAVAVLSNVRSLAFRFLDPRGDWRADWGLPGSAETVPAAVEMTLELASGERIVRLVDLARAP